MGRDKQDCSRNFRSKSWNKIISVLRDRSCNFCSFFKKVVTAHLKNCKITSFFLSSVAKHYFQTPYEDFLFVDQVVK